MLAVDAEHEGLEQADCPKCGSDRSVIMHISRDYLYQIPGQYFISECQQCGLWFQNPRPTADRLADLYPANYGPHVKPEIDQNSGSLTGWSARRQTLIKQLKKLIQRLVIYCRPQHSYLYRRLGYTHLPVEPSASWRTLNMFDWLRKWEYGVALVPHYVPGGRLLEVGCGRGDRLQMLQALGWQELYGLELVQAAADQARAASFSVEDGPAETLLPRYPDNFFDVIITSMVIEHLYNPWEVVHQIATKLKPGGEFLFSTVTRDSLDARIYGIYWSGFDLPRHMVYFRKPDVLQMLTDQFHQIDCFHQNAPIDFARSAQWRNRPIDRLIQTLANSSIGNLVGWWLAWLGLTCRVSFRCRKKVLP